MKDCMYIDQETVFPLLGYDEKQLDTPDYTAYPCEVFSVLCIIHF